jgi:hypothetical protein
MNERHRKNNVFWYRVWSRALEGGIHKMIGIKWIPVYAIVEVGHSKKLLIGGYCRTTSKPSWENVNEPEIVDHTSYRIEDEYAI